MAKRESHTFRAKLGRTWLLYTVDVPEHVGRAMKTKGQVAVVFTVDGSSLRKTTLAPRAGGGHRLHVHGESRREVGAKEGDTVTIVLWRDPEPLDIPLPPDLVEALSEAGVLDTFRTMGPAMQRELSAYVEKAKREATRQKYIARVVERANEVREKRIDRAVPRG
jgi:hypothetical protein